MRNPNWQQCVYFRYLLLKKVLSSGWETLSSCSFFTWTFRPFGWRKWSSFHPLAPGSDLPCCAHGCTFAFQPVFSFSCSSACAARFPAVLLLHKLVSAAASFFCSSRRFPVPLVQNFPSLVLFFSHCPSLTALLSPTTPPPPTMPPCSHGPCM